MIVETIAVGITFLRTPVSVWDGDGPVWCEEGPRVRLHAIAAREIDETCRSNHPCPETSGVEAHDQLVSLIGQPTGRSRHGHVLVSGPVLICRSYGSAGGARVDARCISPSVGDVGCRMVRDGYAVEWSRYGDACDGEGVE